MGGIKVPNDLLFHPLRTCHSAIDDSIAGFAFAFSLGDSVANMLPGGRWYLGIILG
jgi:hypothetical protein